MFMACCTASTNTLASPGGLTKDAPRILVQLCATITSITLHLRVVLALKHPVNTTQGAIPSVTEAMHRSPAVRRHEMPDVTSPCGATVPQVQGRHDDHVEQC